MVLGDELDRLSDSALVAVVEQTDVFARVNPAQKNRLIRALKRKRHVVGYLGDGINDAPSLHSADVGISVSNGVDVAKAAADIILLEKSLAAIHRGVVEGRRSFGNITKYVLMGTSSNFGNMLSMAVAAALLPFLPLLPAQILLNNFLYDVSQLTHPHRQRRRELGGPARANGTRRMIQRFMFGLGSDQLAVRLPHVRRHAVGLPRGSGTVPRRLVHRVAGDADAGHLRHPHGRQPFKSRPAGRWSLTVLGGVLAGLIVVVSPLGGLLGFAPLPPAVLWRPGADDRDLPGSGPGPQASVLRGQRLASILRTTTQRVGTLRVAVRAPAPR